MTTIDITGGNLNIVEHRHYITFQIMGTGVSVHLTQDEIVTYSTLITNVEMFGKTWWEKFKEKMNYRYQSLDSSLVITIEQNIDWWTRDKIIEKVLE